MQSCHQVLDLQPTAAALNPATRFPGFVIEHMLIDVEVFSLAPVRALHAKEMNDQVERFRQAIMGLEFFDQLSGKVPRRPFRLFACATFILLQSSIMLTGNYNFFNFCCLHLTFC